MRRCSFFKLGAVVFLALASLSPTPVPGKGPEPKRAEPAAAALRADMEKARADLASSKQFYLELRLHEKTIALCHSGVDLADYPLDKIQVGYPRVLGFRRGTPGALKWVGSTLKSGAFSPPQVLQRVTIVPGNAATLPTPEEPGIVPPTMTEIMPVPMTYRMEFGNDIEMLFELTGKIPGATQEAESKWTARWEGFLQALGLRASPKVRLKIGMSAEDGARLYRSCPESPSMLVLP